MTYYYPQPNSTGIMDILLYSNSVTNDWFGVVVVFMVFVVGFISQKHYGTERAVASASFLTAISSYLLFAMGLVGSHIILIPTIMTVVSVFFLWKK